MASPKDIKMPACTEPQEPVEAAEAPEADPGQVESVEKREIVRDPARPDTVTVAPRPSSDDTPPEEPPRHWIGVVLKDNEGNPVPNERFRVKLADGSIIEDSLDDKGYKRVEGVEPGSAQVCFPDIDAGDWKTA